MARKSNCCALCEGSNLPSICAICVNLRLSEFNSVLKRRKIQRDSLYSKLEAQLAAKEKVDDRIKWLENKKEKLAKLNDRLGQLQRKHSQGKALVCKTSDDLKFRHAQLEKASSLLERKHVELLEKFYPNLISTQSLGLMAITSELLHKQSVVMKQICRLFPLRRVKHDAEKVDGFNGLYDQICNARLPRGLDPHSVPSEELAASLGYMMQLLNLVVPNLAVPALHNSGFAGSCSRVWQRKSYWDPQPSSRSDEYPLFIPRQNFCSASGETSLSDKSSSNFGVASVEPDKKPCLQVVGSSSFNYSDASPHTAETHKDLQRGILLLKKSVTCITAYCYSLLCLDVPTDLSTFDAFGKLLAILSSSKEMRSVVSSRMASSRSCKQAILSDKTVWHANSAFSSSRLQEKANSTRFLAGIQEGNNLSSSTASFLFSGESPDSGGSETVVEGWDLVEHPKFPPRPYETEDVEHWTRAMFIDAKKR